MLDVWGIKMGDEINSEPWYIGDDYGDNIHSGPGTNVCYGDSGGPVYVMKEGKPQLAGVVDKKYVPVDISADCSRLREYIVRRYDYLEPEVESFTEDNDELKYEARAMTIKELAKLYHDLS